MCLKHTIPDNKCERSEPEKMQHCSANLEWTIAHIARQFLHLKFPGIVLTIGESRIDVFRVATTRGSETICEHGQNDRDSVLCRSLSF